MTTKTIAIIAAAALSAGVAAKAVAADYDCLFCGEGIKEVETETTTITSSSTSCVFCGSGTTTTSSTTIPGTKTWKGQTEWTKALTRVTYLVDASTNYVGYATIKTSKKSSGKVGVKLSIVLATGKKGTGTKTSVTPNAINALECSWSKVKNVGAVAFVLTDTGDVVGTAGEYVLSDTYNKKSASSSSSSTETFEHGSHTFAVTEGSSSLSEKYEFVSETIPTDAAIITSKSTKWNCGKAPAIKYKKVDGEWTLVGLDDDNKTNYSALTLKYNSKKGTVTGSFKVCATNEGSIESGKPKLSKYTFKVSGKIDGSVVTGTAKCSKLKAKWEFVID